MNRDERCSKTFQDGNGDANGDGNGWKNLSTGAIEADVSVVKR